MSDISPLTVSANAEKNSFGLLSMYSIPDSSKVTLPKISISRYAGLNLVLFWWQQADLLADKAAVPAMWVCAILMGAGIGRCIRGR